MTSWARGLCEDVDVAVTIEDVRIHPGDLVLGDRDGVVVVPQEAADTVVTETERVLATEGAVRQAVRAGTDPREAYRRYGKF